MAKHVILEAYAFTPSTRTVVVNGKNIKREQLLLITNVTRNTVIYNFSDPNLTATSYSNGTTNTVGAGGGALEVTTIVLTYNTSSMSDTDKLAILVEETYQEITPSETLMDPVGKLRVSEPQSLIDTDFEYGIQQTKWESTSLLDNRLSAFYDFNGRVNVSNINGSFQGNNSVIVNTVDTVSPGLFVGQPVFVQGTLDPANADGWYMVEGLVANTHFSYRTTGTVQGFLFDPTKTLVFGGNWYSNAAILVNNVTVQSNVIQVTTGSTHGLLPGNSIWLNNTISVPLLNGPWTVKTVPSANFFTCQGYAFTGDGPLTAGAQGHNAGFFSNVLYTRPTSYVQHRAFDGGIQFSSQQPAPNVQVIRQTRRYFRYQSGKGVQFSTGSILKPALATDYLTAVGSVVTVNTKQTHGLGLGANITVSNSSDPAYNGTFGIASIPNKMSFTYNALSSPTTTPAPGFPINISPASWYGSKTRIGMFDHQNGFFYEYDGQQLWAVKRSSVNQIAGFVSVTQSSGVVRGTNTQFGRQLMPQDFIVIRGQSYQVQTIVNDTEMIISPEYRGVSSIRSLVSKTIDIKYPQYQWNIDPCDGTGPSAYNLDLTRMQMFYMDFSWYGAGAIRFGFKNNRGEVIYCHRITNNNLNFEAYMRSGNLPARYEINTAPPYSILTSTLGTSSATLQIAGPATDFPNVGQLYVANAGLGPGAVTYVTAGAGGLAEILSYTARTGNVFTIGSRALAGGVPSANTFTYQANVPISVQLLSSQFAPTISHWGSAVIMDGKYDDDKSLVFNVGQNNPLVNPTPYVRNAVISLRISPSVDNGLTGQMGQREIINRMQLVLRQMDTLTTGPYRVDVILNGTPQGPGFWTPAGGSSLAQYVLHPNATPIVGGESIFSFFTNTTGATQQDMTLVRELGTSIMGGGANNNVANVLLGKFPDGPDMITLCVTPLNLTSNINARISWTEAQA